MQRVAVKIIGPELITIQPPLRLAPHNLLLLLNSTDCEVTTPVAGKGPGSHGCAPGAGSAGVPHP